MMRKTTPKRLSKKPKENISQRGNSFLFPSIFQKQVIERRHTNPHNNQSKIKAPKIRRKTKTYISKTKTKNQQDSTTETPKRKLLTLSVPKPAPKTPQKPHSNHKKEKQTNESESTNQYKQTRWLSALKNTNRS